MLENIIKNPIETPRGYKNPDYGIALRGPLSQFFSALYLKPLDDSFSSMDVTYIRYQDDIIILCQTKRQLERCEQRLMGILKERRLGLSRKKTRIGSIDKGFHFLGINYLETQPLGGTNVTQTRSESATQVNNEHFMVSMGGEDSSTIADHSVSEQKRIVPHARTLRNAREQVKQMVASGVSLQRIKRYLLRWCTWWMQTADCWSKHELLIWFFETCWDKPSREIASELCRSISQLSLNEASRLAELNPN